MGLSEQKVLVIGGSSGMGLAIATASARAGAEVLIASRSDSRLKETLGKALPVKRVGLPSDIASVAIELMSNSFITGTVIDVDGGGLLS